MGAALGGMVDAQHDELLLGMLDPIDDNKRQDDHEWWREDAAQKGARKRAASPRERREAPPTILYEHSVATLDCFAGEIVLPISMPTCRRAFFGDFYFRRLS